MRSQSAGSFAVGPRRSPRPCLRRTKVAANQRSFWIPCARDLVTKTRLFFLQDQAALRQAQCRWGQKSRWGAAAASVPQRRFRFVPAISSRSSSAERQLRLSHAPKKPKATLTVTTTYERNPDVIVEVLMRAHGKCERCGSDAPFARRSDNTPYLEVHHIQFLADDGDDTVANAIALCPNCHRYLHHGTFEKKETDALKDQTLVKL